MRRTPRAAAAVLALTVAGALAACSSGSPGSSGSPTDDVGSPSAPAEDTTAAAPSGDLEPGSSSLGYPAALGDTLLDAEAAAGLAWTTDPTLLYVITLGSSTCPVVAEPDATGDAAGVVVTFVPIPADTACTMDLVPTTTVVALPDGVGPDVDLTVDLDGIGSATLPSFEAVAGAPVLVPVTAG